LSRGAHTCKAYQEEHLVQNALRVNFKGPLPLLFAKNNVGYVDKTEHKLTAARNGAEDLASALLASEATDEKSVKD
jgi:hypothetical protein